MCNDALHCYKDYTISDEILAFDGHKWETVAKMNIERKEAAVAEVDVRMIEFCNSRVADHIKMGG